MIVSAITGAVTTCLALIYRNVPVSTDRAVAVAAGNHLMRGGWNVYAVVPKAQMGPAALFLAAAVPATLFIVVVGASAGLFVWLAYDATGAAPQPVHAAAGLMAAFAWHRWAYAGHADDVIVLLGVAVTLLGGRAKSGPLAAAGFVLAMLGKPTAILMLPLVWLVSRRAAVAAFLIAGACWLPFFLASPHGFLNAGRGINEVWTSSVWGMIGVTGSYPPYVRPLQLVLGAGACWLIGRRHGLPAAVVTAFAIRAALEPGAMPLYWQSIVAAALVADLRHRVPVVTMIAFVGLVVNMAHARNFADGLVRLLLLVLVAAAAVVTDARPTNSQRRLPRRTDDRPQYDPVAADA